jgi:hypothetical protein
MLSTGASVRVQINPFVGANPFHTQVGEDFLALIYQAISD